MSLFRVSGHLYAVSFDSNLGDVEVRRMFHDLSASQAWGLVAQRQRRSMIHVHDG